MRAGRLTSAHDVSDGGLACALAECAIAGGVGVRADLDPMVELRGMAGESCLFGEGPGGFVVAGEQAAIDDLAAAIGEAGALVIGEAGGNRIEVSAAEAELAVELADAERGARWASASAPTLPAGPFASIVASSVGTLRRQELAAATYGYRAC